MVIGYAMGCHGHQKFLTTTATIGEITIYLWSNGQKFYHDHDHGKNPKFSWKYGKPIN